MALADGRAARRARRGDPPPAARPGARWRRPSRPGPPTPTSSGARAGRARRRRRGPSRPSCSPTARPTPRAPAAAPCSIPRRTPTWSGCARPGAQHLVDDVRESVIRAASLRPVEGERRVFVIEEAEDLRDESQNALLKTLEEPAPFAHLILVCSEPELLAGTILSRCQAGRVRAAGAGGGARDARRVRRRRPTRPPGSAAAIVELARFLLSDERARRCGPAPRPPRAPPATTPRRPSPGAPCSTRPSAPGAEAGAEEERRLPGAGRPAAAGAAARASSPARRPIR